MFYLISGGAASGKSELAEALILRKADGKRLYIATMQPFGQMAQEKIARHQRLRAGKGFDTLERCRDIASPALPAWYDGVLTECVSNLLANEMFSGENVLSEGIPEKIVSGLVQIKQQCGTLVVVTGEVGSDGMAYSEETMLYVHNLAKVNNALARIADGVAEAVCGIAVISKGAEWF